MVRCVVPGCKSDKNKSLPNFQPSTLHKFPFPIEKCQRKRWLQSIGIREHSNMTSDGLSASVCQFHFLDSYFVPNEENIDKKGRPLKTPKLKKG